MRSIFYNFLYIGIPLFFLYQDLGAWGFSAHKRINRQAVFSLPPEMIGFFKQHLEFITENAVNPDKRRYAVMGEAEKHFIDIDAYGDSAIYTLPRYWQQAVLQFGEDSLRAYGIAPWNVNRCLQQLTQAFARNDIKAILRLAADLGHYIGDINVPLHTTKNYNGQFTGQYGIHGFWETRIPELLSEDYDFLVGKASFVDQPQLKVWEAVAQAHLALDSVFLFEKEVSRKFPSDKKFSFEERGGITIKVYSKEFTRAYHRMLNGQVERQMQKSIKMIADFWYTAWVNAGQPELDRQASPSEEDEIFHPREDLLHRREHEGLSFLLQL